MKFLHGISGGEYSSLFMRNWLLQTSLLFFKVIFFLGYWSMGLEVWKWHYILCVFFLIMICQIFLILSAFNSLLPTWSSPSFGIFGLHLRWLFFLENFSLISSLREFFSIERWLLTQLISLSLSLEVWLSQLQIYSLHDT